jgi:hypothetical protein
LSLKIGNEKLLERKNSLKSSNEHLMEKNILNLRVKNCHISDKK